RLSLISSLFCLCSHLHPRDLHSFPTRRSSDLTVIGLATMALLQTKTLILTPNISASRQWIREIIDKTSLTIDQVKEYSGEVKEIDRKSTRLNSSHVKISYAVFCLKKKIRTRRS